MSFEIIPAGDRLHDLMLFGPYDKPEFIGRFDNKVRAWMAAKEIAAQRGIRAGDAPWMRFDRIARPEKQEPHRF